MTMIDTMHPGDVLKDKLAGLKISARELSRRMEMSHTRVAEIMTRERGVTADTALRLEKAFPELSAERWMAMQVAYELDMARARFSAARQPEEQHA